MDYELLSAGRWLNDASTYRINLFKKSASMLPICRRKHWLLAIVSHPEVNHGKSSRIYIVDSKKNAVSGVEVIDNIRQSFGGSIKADTKLKWISARTLSPQSWCKLLNSII
uniref:Ubiquitin-like protease family profile domain-containing protein n=1 Tax=Glossina morsitans morsitans TaxID=37546 RepID=A0A1B0FEV2_GLOMM